MTNSRSERKNRDLSRNKTVADIHLRQSRIEGLDDEELLTKSRELKYWASSGTNLRKLIPEVFALVSEVSKRTVGMKHFDVQLLAGIELAKERIAEMQTGEGKTLTATLPVYLFALAGKGVHVSTVNDYLAKRDSEFVSPIFERLGLSVGVVQAEDTPDARRIAYSKDVTYGNSKEFGFDFLRDRMAIRAANGNEDHATGVVMRGLNFALVDEADCILIDEARTPLIIGITNPKQEDVSADCYRWASEHAAEFVENEDFRVDEQTSQVHLKPAGIHKLRSLPQNAGTRMVGLRELYRHMETAIKVRRDFKKDRNYAVRFNKKEDKDKIEIIDEFTGRIAEGRQWQQGIHQAVEAKEGIDITPATTHAARITVQELFRRYRHFAGMTGTAWTSRRELKSVFKKKVVRIPTNRISIRVRRGTKVFGTWNEKVVGIVRETKQLTESGRAVLIGSRSVGKSELLSVAFRENGIEHQVLNAKYLEQEAAIIAQAGEPGKVTIATNMAGRGTDIKLDEVVERAGGLHVILTEFHESRRIDRQLIGRCGRQGDRGSYQIFLSFDDDVLVSGLGTKRGKRLAAKFSDMSDVNSSTERLFIKAQKKVERKQLVDRMILVRQNKERIERQREMGMDPYLDLPE